MVYLQVVFMLVTLAALVLFYVGTRQKKYVAAFYVLWCLGVGLLASTGFLQNTQALPPRMLLVLVPAMLSIVVFTKWLVNQQLKLGYLLAIHALRLPVELVLLGLFNQGKIPVTMTFHGWNFDILIGASAVVMLLCYKLGYRFSATFLIAWNVLGLVMVSFIVVLSILSSPLPIQQLAFEQPNVAVLQFPFVYLPAVVVPIVYVAHILGLYAVAPYLSSSAPRIPEQ